MLKEIQVVFRRISAPPCTVGFNSLKPHLKIHLLKNMERFVRKSCTEIASFDYFNELSKYSYRVEFQRLSTKIQAAVLFMDNAVFGGRGTVFEVIASGCEAPGSI